MIPRRLKCSNTWSGATSEWQPRKARGLALQCERAAKFFRQSGKHALATGLEDWSDKSKKRDSSCGSVIFQRGTGDLDEAIDIIIYEFGVSRETFPGRLVEAKLLALCSKVSIGNVETVVDASTPGSEPGCTDVKTRIPRLRLLSCATSKAGISAVEENQKGHMSEQD